MEQAAVFGGFKPVTPPLVRHLSIPDGITSLQPRTRLSKSFSIITIPSPMSISPESMPNLRTLHVEPPWNSPGSVRPIEDLDKLNLLSKLQAYSTPVSRREWRMSSSNDKERKRNCYVYRENEASDDSVDEITFSASERRTTRRNSATMFGYPRGSFTGQDVDSTLVVSCS